MSTTLDNPQLQPAASGTQLSALSSQPARSPLARLSNLIQRGYWSIRHYGPTLGGLFLGAQEDLVKEHQLELSLAARSAVALEGQTHGFCAHVAAIFADGIVDRTERRWLKRHMPELRQAATAHTTQIKKLAE